MSLSSVEPSSCCSWLSCASATNVSNGGLKNRFCPHWRMAPGILVLAASVIAAVCAIIWDCTLLCIAFGTSGVASLYLIYLGWDFQNLTSFAENNRDFEDSLRLLEKENRSLQEKLGVFEGENKKLQESTKSLSTLVHDIQLENVSLADANASLKQMVLSLERLKSALEVKLGTQVDRLQGLQHSLAGLESSVKEDHTSFSENLSRFVAEVKHLHDTRNNLEHAASTVEEKMKQQVEVLLATAKTLQGIFSKVEEWKDESYIKKQIETQQLLHKSSLDITEQVARKESQLALQAEQLERLKQQLAEQEAQIQKMEGLNTKFGVKLAKLAKSTDQIEGIAAGLKATHETYHHNKGNGTEN